MRAALVRSVEIENYPAFDNAIYESYRIFGLI